MSTYSQPTPNSGRRTMRVDTSQRGATLIEVLVAIVVLSIGLLGLAGLQMTGLQSNHSAYLRSQASLLAYDLGDQMRAKRAAALTGGFDDESEGDRADWDTSVTALLGADAQGTLLMVGREVTITIQWNETRGCIKTDQRECAANDDDDQVFVYRTQI